MGPLFCGSNSDLLASFLEDPPPKFTIRGKARHQRVEKITLRVCQIAVVADPLEIRLDAAAGLERRTFGRAVEEDVKIDLEFADIFFESRELLIEQRRVFLFRRRLPAEFVS